MSSNLKRSQYVDIAKGVAIIAIVLGHIDYVYPENSLLQIQSIVYGLWHVTVFFLLAGFFIKEEQLRNPQLFFKKKFSSLYLKILYLYIPAVLLHNVLIDMGWYSLESIDPVITRYSTIDFLKQSILTVCLGGREPIVGPMWFVYVLFIALIGLSIVSWCIGKISKNERQYEWLRFIALLIMCMMAGILSNKYGLTIRRFSNTFTAMLLIYLGKTMYQRMKLDFNNVYLCVACLLIVFEVSCMLGSVGLNGNNYRDILQLIVAGPAMLYVIMFVGKRIEHLCLGKCLAYIGNNSFYIMALHFCGFKICSEILSSMKLWGGVNVADLTPYIGSNILLLMLYIVFGVGMPLLFMHIFRFFRQLIANHK